MPQTQGDSGGIFTCGYHNPTEEYLLLPFYCHPGPDCTRWNRSHDWNESHLNPTTDKQRESIPARLQTPITASGRIPNCQKMCFCLQVTPYATLNLWSIEFPKPETPQGSGKNNYTLFPERNTKEYLEWSVWSANRRIRWISRSPSGCRLADWLKPGSYLLHYISCA